MSEPLGKWKPCQCPEPWRYDLEGKWPCSVPLVMPNAGPAAYCGECGHTLTCHSQPAEVER